VSDGRSGFISIKVKDSATSEGGHNIDMKAGSSHDKMQRGSSVSISAGDGLSDADRGDGGDGGNRVIVGGYAYGLFWVD
jgi:deoxyxylulose-5-phosphate synthase